MEVPSRILLQPQATSLVFRCHHVAPRAALVFAPLYMEVVEVGALKILRGVSVAVCVAMGVALIIASGAMASGTKLCISEKEGGSVKTPKGGVCPKKYQLTELGEPSVLSKAEQEELKELRRYVKLIPSGIDGKPTVQVTGANVQVASGPKERESNGTGNVVIGADEEPAAQTGSNNLVLGGPKQEYTSNGGILAGIDDKITAPLASVLGGETNRATSEGATVSGGHANTASGHTTSVTGGVLNRAESESSSVSGGVENTASSYYASVSGGGVNSASGFGASIFGGKNLTAPNEYEAIP